MKVNGLLNFWGRSECTLKKNKSLLQVELANQHKEKISKGFVDRITSVCGVISWHHALTVEVDSRPLGLLSTLSSLSEAIVSTKCSRWSSQMWTLGNLTCLNCKVILVQISEHMVAMVQCSISVILEIKEHHMITVSV